MLLKIKKERAFEKLYSVFKIRNCSLEIKCTFKKTKQFKQMEISKERISK